MITPTEADIGRKVIYRPYWEPNRPPETGTLRGLKAIGDSRCVYVYFNYSGREASAIVERRDLEWAP